MTTPHVPNSAPVSLIASMKLRAIADELAGQFIERQDVIDGLLIALIAKQHALLLGPPGTGKSALARATASRITGVSTGASPSKYAGVTGARMPG